MLKRIKTEDLAIGMFVQEFCGSWMDHPFWRASFLLKEASDLERIRATSIRELWIDTDRGLDVPASAFALSREEVDERIDTDFGTLAISHAAELASRPESLHAELNVSLNRCLEPTGTIQEMQAAALVCQQALGFVGSMFREARLGRMANIEVATKLVDNVSDSISRNPVALISLVRLKTADSYTYMHSVAVCALMVALARQLKMSDDHTRSAGLAGLLHDLGKVAIPNEVLNKPGKLSEHEFDVIRHHPVAGHELLKAGGQVSAEVLDACLHHHEKMDGSGYPHRLAAEQISVMARMTAVCDVYDAITSDRPYKRGWDPSEALRHMAEWSGGHFDTRVFHAFVKCVGIYPVGSLVRLNSGRLGVVAEQSNASLVNPQVLVFYSTRSGLRIPPEIIHMGTPQCQDSIAKREDPAKWNFPDLHEMWTGIAGRPW